MSKFLQAIDIQRSYGRDSNSTVALKRVNLTIRKSEIVSIMGPSGSGKSTLLNIIAGLAPHDGGSGEVLVHGHAVTRPKPAQMAYMFQDSVLYPWRTVIKNIEFGLEAQPIDRKERRARALKYLDMVGLRDFADYFPRQLSGGMSQRVALCRALALESGIILMDEPFGALDEQSRIILGDELIEIWRKVRRTVVFVTHSLTEAVYLGDRIAVFTARPGRIKVEIENNLPRPRTIGGPEFNTMVDTLWKHLKDESIASLKREEAGSNGRRLPKE